MRLIQSTSIALAMASASAWGGVDLSVEVGYGFGGVSSSGIYAAAPDTGFVLVTNSGMDPFEGVLNLSGPSGFGVFGGIVVADLSGPILLGPGASWILLAGPEGSNYGGYNKNQPFTVGDPASGQNPADCVDTGLLFEIMGVQGGMPVSYGIYDHEIHSGVFALNPFGTSLDNYILQGGDPWGRDTLDPFEVAQAHAFIHVTGDRTAVPAPAGPCVPEPGTTGALIAAGLGLAASIKRARQPKQ